MEDNNSYLSSIIRWCEIDRKLYFKSGFHQPGTFYYDLDEDKVFLIDEDEETAKWLSFAYGEVVASQNKAIFIPHDSDCICIYDTIAKRMSYKKKKYSEKYYYGLQYNDSIIMIPYETEHINRIMMYDPINDITEYPFENIEFDVGIKGYGCINGEIIYLPIKGRKQLLKIGLKNSLIEYVDVDVDDLEIDSVSFINHSLYLAGNRPYIIKWSGVGQYKKITIVQLGMADGIGELALMGKGIYFDNSLIYTLSYRGSICRLDLKSEEITEQQVVCMDAGESIGFSNVCDDFFYFELYKKNRISNIPYLVGKNGNVRKLEAFAMDMKIDLSNYAGFTTEYSKYALQHFLNRLRKNK